MQKLKIAVPDNNIFKRLYANDNPAIEIIPVKEDNIMKLVSMNRVDGGLLNPLSYGVIRNNLDIRVINSYALAGFGYTNLIKVLLKPGIKKIKSVGVSKEKTYATIMTKIMLAERYGIEIEPEETSKNNEDIIKDYDVAIILDENYYNPNTLDLTENWTDSYAEPFPFAFWCLRADIDLPNAEEIFDSLYQQEKPKTEEVKEKINNIEAEPRVGELIWRWDKNLEKSCDNVLEILFYHQYLGEIFDIKMYNQNEEPTDETTDTQ